MFRIVYILEELKETPVWKKGNSLKNRTHFPEYSGENRVEKVQTV